MKLKRVKSDLQCDINNIIKLRNDGMRYKDIAKIYNTSPSSIGRILRENGVWTRTELTQDDIKDIIQKYQDGHSIAEIGKFHRKTGKDISSLLKENNVDIIGSEIKNRKYTIDENYFDCVDSDEKAYIIGLLMSDGNITRNNISISLQESDKDVLDKINKLVGSNRPLHYIKMNDKNKKWKNQYKLSITNKHMANRLKELGIIENKSLTLNYPYWLSDSLFPSFLRGVIDGDGTISKERCRVRIIGTKMLLDGIHLKLKSLGIHSAFYHSKHHNDATWNLYIGGKNNSIFLLNMLYKNSTIHIERKYQTYMEKYINNSLTA